MSKILNLSIKALYSSKNYFYSKTIEYSDKLVEFFDRDLKDL